MSLGVGPDGLDRAFATAALAEVALADLHAARDRVDMGVLEPGDEQPAGEVHDPRARPDPRRDIARGPDRGDSLADDGDRLRPRQGGVDRVDVAPVRTRSAGRGSIAQRSHTGRTDARPAIARNVALSATSSAG